MRHESVLREFLAEESAIDGVLLFTDGMHSVARPSYFEFFAGASPVGERNCLLLDESEEPAILVDLPRDVDRLRRHTDVRDVRGRREFATALGQLLEERGLTGAVGLAGSNRMPLGVFEQIERSVNAVEPVDEKLSAVRPRETPRERDIFSELGRIADRGFRTAYEVVRPGMKEYEIAAEVEEAMRSAGAEDNFNLFGSGSHNELMHSPTERIVREGDALLLELSPMVQGYVLQICRTVSIGTPDPTLSEKFSLLTEALRLTKARLGPGVEASVVSETMNEVFRREGYDEYCRPPYMRTRGHGFGFGPLGMAITEETDVELDPGTILVVHPNQYVPETGYLALGDPIRIADDGAETLTSTAPRLFTKEVVR